MIRLPELLHELKEASVIPGSVDALHARLVSVLTKYILMEARSYEGVLEEGNNAGEMVEKFQQSTKSGKAPWCVSFLVYVINDKIAKPLGFSDILPRTASSQALYAYAKKYDLLTKTPKPGDIAIWRNGNTWTGHVGLILDVLDKTLLTIEGNTGPQKAVEREGDGVYIKNRSWAKLGEWHAKLWLRGILDMEKLLTLFIIEMRKQSG